MSEKSIGNLNGNWALMFKIAILAVPLLVALEAWQVDMIYQLRQDVALDKQRIIDLETHEH